MQLMNMAGAGSRHGPFNGPNNGSSTAYSIDHTPPSNNVYDPRLPRTQGYPTYSRSVDSDPVYSFHNGQPLSSPTGGNMDPFPFSHPPSHLTPTTATPNSEPFTRVPLDPNHQPMMYRYTPVGGQPEWSMPTNTTPYSAPRHGESPVVGFTSIHSMIPPSQIGGPSQSPGRFPALTRRMSDPPGNCKRSQSGEYSGGDGDSVEEISPHKWGIPDEEYNALNPKDKKQVRNRVGARKFRLKRRNYLQGLESRLAARNGLVARLRSEIISQRAQINTLRTQAGLSPLPAVADDLMVDEEGADGSLPA